MAAFAELTAADLAAHAGAKVEDCLRCAVVIQQFVSERLTRGGRVFIEDD
jgi:hypothetical protein